MQNLFLDFEPAKPSKKNCFDEREKLSVQYGRRVLGLYMPECQADGLFATRQCKGSSCWCANAYNGQEIPNTKMSIRRRGNCEVYAPPGWWACYYCQRVC